MTNARVALVTGCGKHLGIGAAAARRLSQSGYAVAVSDFDVAGVSNYNEVAADNAEAIGIDGLVREIEGAGGSALGLLGDVASEEDANRMVSEVLDRFGRLDVLVNNAAAPQEPLLGIEDLAIDAWQRILQVNLTGAFLMCRAAVPPMREAGWGRIVNISSVMGKKGRAKRLGYSTSKAGILGLTRALALEVAPYGIAVNAVCPGPILTTRAFSSARRDGAVEEWMKRGRSAVPMGRLGTAEDVAATVAYLASEDCQFTTGQALDVDGGWGI